MFKVVNEADNKRWNSTEGRYYIAKRVLFFFWVYHKGYFDWKFQAEEELIKEEKRLLKKY